MAQREYNTFSAAVDSCVTRSSRMDRRTDIISYLRLTLRETQILAYFFRDLVEDQITGVTSDPHVWETPQYFRIMRHVSYPHLVDNRRHIISPDFVELGNRQQDSDYLYYGSGDSVVFVGHGLNQVSSLNVSINIAYFSYFAPLAYFPEAANRPARYLIDDETGAEGWEYHASYAATAELQAQARALATNWLLERWFEVAVEGALAKLYKTTDDARSVGTYALYKQLQNTLLGSESRLAINLGTG